MRGIGGRARVMVKLFIRLIPGYALFFFSILALGLLYGNIVGDNNFIYNFCIITL